MFDKIIKNVRTVMRKRNIVALGIVANWAIKFEWFIIFEWKWRHLACVRWVLLHVMMWFVGLSVFFCYYIIILYWFLLNNKYFTRSAMCLFLVDSHPRRLTESIILINLAQSSSMIQSYDNFFFKDLIGRDIFFLKELCRAVYV